MAAKRIICFLLIIALLAVFSVCYPELTGNISNADSTEYPKEEAMFLRVVDGDTIHALVNGEDQTIRMLGINAPEKKMPFSNESKLFLEQFVNQTIYLQRDVEDEDKYDRKLRYVFADEGNRFLNLELLELGYVSSYIFGEQTYNKEILRAEEQARNLGLGIWQKSQEECAVQDCISLLELNPAAEVFKIKNSCDFACDMTGWFVKDTGRNVFYLSNLSNLEEQVYSSELLGKDVWDDSGDNFFMFDKEGKLVIFYEYSS
jgi:micrococcal nuclease